MIKLEHKEQVFELWSTDGYNKNRVAYFSNKTDADTILRKLNGGKDYGYYRVTATYTPDFVIFESTAEYEGYNSQIIKDKALAKLTKEEKQALGLL